MQGHCSQGDGTGDRQAGLPGPVWSPELRRLPSPTPQAGGWTQRPGDRAVSPSIPRFINARRRILQPMLDSSCSETPKTKKKTAQNRPVQRFWPDSIASGAAQPPPSELAMSEGGRRWGGAGVRGAAAFTSRPGRGGPVSRGEGAVCRAPCRTVVRSSPASRGPRAPCALSTATAQAALVCPLGPRPLSPHHVLTCVDAVLLAPVPISLVPISAQH